MSTTARRENPARGVGLLLILVGQMILVVVALGLVYWALVITLAIFVLVFAVAYVSLSRQRAESFSEPLDKISGLYFAVTVVATVGFGDIAPRTDLALAITTAQMLLDLVFIATARRVLATTATRGARSRAKPETES